MKKTIMITGATDGIGSATAKKLIESGNTLIIHGRNQEKINKIVAQLKQINPTAEVYSVLGDFSNLEKVKEVAEIIKNRFQKVDILINNAGIFTSNIKITENGLEERFAVNAIAPYLLTRVLLPIIPDDGRVVNLSSAAQSPINPIALKTGIPMDDNSAYAQSKLTLTMWSFSLADELKEIGKNTAIIAVNPKSFLGSKMVKEAYGRDGYNLEIGADILIRAALSDEFKNASGKYFDNDYGVFTTPHLDVLDYTKRNLIMDVLNEIIESYL